MTPDLPNMREGMLSTERLEFYHLRLLRPKCPKVLFLGGSNFDLRLKRTFLETPLARHCDIAAYEPRGIGRTGQPAGAWTMRDYALDALAFLDALCWSDAIVLGESFGGMTALHMAKMAPSRVRALVIASATAGGAEHASYDIAEFLALSREQAADKAICLQDSRIAALRTDNPDAFARHLTARLEFEAAFADPSITSGGYARLLNARRAHDCSQSLDQVTAPTTVIAGRFDLQARPGAQKALADALPNASFKQFDAGHGVLFASPDATRTALDAIMNASARHEDQEIYHHD